MITLHDRSTQTSDVIAAHRTSKPEVELRRQSAYFRSVSDDDEDNGSELLLPVPVCSRCDTRLSQHGRYRRALREVAPRNDVMKSRDRRAETPAAAADEVITTRPPVLTETGNEHRAKGGDALWE